jgi:hypothetical protein
MSLEDHRELLRLATFTRKEGREEIRWTVEEFTPPTGTVTRFIEARKWTRNDRGEMRPTQAAVTIRAHEIAEVAAALQRAVRR